MAIEPVAVISSRARHAAGRARRLRYSRFASFVGAAATGAAALLAPAAQGLSVDLSLFGENLTEGVINLSCGTLSSTNLCVRVVTHAVVNGNVVHRERDIAPSFGLLGIVGQPIDVTGDGAADVSVSISVPVTLLPPGYDAQKPTLTVNKLSGAPSLLPLKLEVVTNDGANVARKISFGYDSRTSTAPSSFVAAIDQSDRDGSSKTSQVLVNLTIGAGNSRAVGLVQESFVAGANLSEGLRLDRNITQLTFRAAAATATLPATQMPTSVRLDATSSDDKQRFIVTSSPASTADVLLAKPNDDPRISGTIARLPGRIDLELTGRDIDKDGASDETAFDYAGSEVVPEAFLRFSELAKDPPPDDPDGEPQDHRRVLDITATSLPGEVDFVFSSKASTVHMKSSARIPSVVVQGVDERPFFKRATSLELRLTDLPRILDAGFADGHISFNGQAPVPGGTPVPDALGSLVFRGYDVVPTPPPQVCLPPFDCDILGSASNSGVVFTDTSSPIFVGGPFLLYARVFKLRSADVITTPDLDVYVDTAPDIAPTIQCQVTPIRECESFRKFVANITKADTRFRESVTTINATLSALVPGTLFRQSTLGANTPTNPDDDYGIISYSNDGSRGSPDLRLDATNLPGLPTGQHGAPAKHLHVGLTSMPNSMTFSYAGGGFPLQFDASGVADSTLDKLEVRMNSAGATETFPQTENVAGVARYLDGVMIRDYTDRFVIDARVRGLRHAIIDKDVHLRERCEPFDPGCGVLDPGAMLMMALTFPGQGEPPYPCSEGDTICIEAVTSSSDQPRLRFDSKVGIPGLAAPPGDGWWITGTHEVIATLDEIPPTLLLRQFEGTDEESRLAYTASRTIPGGLQMHDNDIRKQYMDGVHIEGGDQIGTKAVDVTPLPATFSTCKSSDKITCAAGMFEGETQANAGSFSLNASERTRLRLTEIPNHDHLGTFTEIDLSFNSFSQAAHAGDGHSFIGLDTGWDSMLGAPPASAKVGGFIRHYKEFAFYQEGEEFRIPTGFAADGREVSWYSTLELLVAQNGGDVYPIERAGKVSCPQDIAIDLTREAVNDTTITIDLGDDMCLHQGWGDPTPD